MNGVRITGTVQLITQLPDKTLIALIRACRLEVPGSLRTEKRTVVEVAGELVPERRGVRYTSMGRIPPSNVRCGVREPRDTRTDGDFVAWRPLKYGDIHPPNERARVRFHEQSSPWRRGLDIRGREKQIKAVVPSRYGEQIQ